MHPVTGHQPPLPTGGRLDVKACIGLWVLLLTLLSPHKSSADIAWPGEQWTRADPISQGSTLRCCRR